MNPPPTLPDDHARLTTRVTLGVSVIARRALFVAACALVSLVGTIPTHASPAGRDCQPDKPVRFAVLSDTHLYDARLGITGSAFEMYLAADPKLLALSEPILASAVADIIKSKVRFVIISGDLTKDGELVDHLLMVRYLDKLERAGIQVFVVPGNHDINNHDAARYSGDTATPIPSVSPQLFRFLYQPFGYGQAIDHAPDSLSYVAEPVPGLWLLALDSAKWAESAQAEHPVVSGRLTDATMAWALKKLHQAQVRGKQVIAFMHHGVNLHFGAEPIIFPDYLVDNWPVVGAQLAGAGLKVIFTGHYHSQDASIVSIDADGNPQPSTLCDIETGSLVMEPCAYRIAELDCNGLLHVASPRINSIAVNLGMPFQQYADGYLRALLPYQVTFELKYLFGLSDADAAAVAPLVVDALIANYDGDEDPSEATLATLQWLLSFPAGSPYNTLGQLLGTLWIDNLPPSDNQLVVLVKN
jgi:DNA repair exonuclease SbcCD nuclease subunit